MPSTVDLSGLGRLQDRLKRLAHPPDREFARLMITWMDVISDDNRRGILAGQNKDGNPMVPVTYRPKPPGPVKLTPSQRNTPNNRLRRGAFAGIGSHPAGLNNNLTSAEYRRLAGPPLAPRGAFSRVITNLRTRFGSLLSVRWEAVGYWDEVVSTKGVPFLRYHFDGASGGGRSKTVRLPRRDLRGIRPWGVARARSSLRAWGIDLVRSSA